MKLFRPSYRSRTIGRSFPGSAALIVAFLLSPLMAGAQSASISQAPEKTPDAPVTMLPHSDTTRWYIGGQFNTILQWHGSFPARYSGPNSFRNAPEAEDSRVATLYLGVEVTKSTEVLFDGESVGGRGVSDALGLAGYTNLDVVRNPDLGVRPYIARLILHQVVALGGGEEEAARTPLSLFTRLPTRRLEIRFGKFSTADFFDENSVASDSHLQFMNWTVDNTGAFDYAADTRGYTWGLVLDLHLQRWSFRFGELLMPKVANGLKLEHDITQAGSQNFEVEFRPHLFAGRNSAIRVTSFVNRANMGNYETAVALFRRGITSAPDITATRRPGAIKLGIAMNAEQEFAQHLRGFVRLGWNDDSVESFAYTEVGQTVAFGADLAGNLWKRPFDKAGVALVSNGISKAHQEYLRLGGVGFLLGDGGLTYGRETVFETYYSAHFWRGLFGSFDVQHINNPGYNRDRGPIWVPGLRLHVDF